MVSHGPDIILAPGGGCLGLTPSQQLAANPSFAQCLALSSLPLDARGNGSPEKGSDFPKATQRASKGQNYLLTHRLDEYFWSTQGRLSPSRRAFLEERLACARVWRNLEIVKGVGAGAGLLGSSLGSATGCVTLSK